MHSTPQRFRQHGKQKRRQMEAHPTRPGPLSTPSSVFHRREPIPSTLIGTPTAAKGIAFSSSSQNPEESCFAAASQRRRHHNRAMQLNNQQPGRRRHSPVPLTVISDPETCRSAAEELSNCERLAVDCEGVSLSRTGRLCLLQLASDKAIYFVDLVGPNAADLSYARAMFDVGGLRNLLQDPKVHKVLHDCRHDSDALYHQFGVKLGPVIDTQVVFTVLRRVRGMEEGLPVSLKTLLKKFAGVSEEDLSIKNTVKESMKGNDDYWLKRPLSEQALRYARFDVEHLLYVTRVLWKLISNVSPTGWQAVLDESKKHLSVFRDDEDGPRKAHMQYEKMARVARRQRAAHEQRKKAENHRKEDPMRHFVFDQARIVEVLDIPSVG